MDLEKRKSPGERFNDICEGRTEEVMIAFWDTAPYLNSFAGVGIREYYFHPDIKMRVQTAFQEEFPDALLLPGIWADYGALCEPSAFGCEIVWPESGMPTARPVLKSSGDVKTLKVPDPRKAGLMPQALDEYRFFWDHLDPKYIDGYGYLKGVAASFGPVELAAVLMGHENFFTQLISEPGLIRSRLEITTESVLQWLHAHESINGPLKRIALADHIPGQIGPHHFEEFFLPYTIRVIEAFPDAMILYHNEYPIRYLPLLNRLKASVFHFGGSLREAKEALGKKMTLMGNLDPVGLLLNGTPQEVEEQAVECLKEGAPGGRFLLSSAGGLAPETPLQNLKAIDEALRGNAKSSMKKDKR